MNDYSVCPTYLNEKKSPPPLKDESKPPISITHQSNKTVFTHITRVEKSRYLRKPKYMEGKIARFDEKTDYYNSK